ncbi:MAG: Rid family hydrolase [Syntrophaceae bacterium]
MPKFESIEPWGTRDYTYSTAVKRGSHLFISGVVARDPATGEIVGKGDIAAQTDYIFKLFAGILKKAGGSLDDIVKTVDYVTTLENYKQTADVRRKYFRNGFPAATGIVVKQLVNRNALIEIDAIAIIE